MECNGVLTREDLRERYGVESEFVRVKELAKIMGVSAATIYAQMREGEFALPVRRVGEMLLVRVDHLLAWLNGPGEACRLVVGVPAAASQSGEKQAAPPSRAEDRVQAAIERARAEVEKARARRSASPGRRARA